MPLTTLYEVIPYLIQCFSSKMPYANVEDRRRYERNDKKKALRKKLKRKQPIGQLALYKRSARLRNLAFQLTFEQFSELVTNPNGCFYCGSQRTEDEPLEVDRQDNNEGYTIENSVPCCKPCNWAKRDRSAFDFVEHCKRVAAHNK